ncbi:MAG: hypothetical protein K6T78_10680 [Alicyclobacillus sp.]|nr:hypothetical protein [Alicyclobacillus sp.]
MKPLTIMELATLASAAGTLALACTSFYQLRRGRKDQLHPMVYADALWLDATRSAPHADDLQLERICLHLKNYGTGPALDVRFRAKVQTPRSNGTAAWVELPIDQLVNAGEAVQYMNLAPNEDARVELRMDAKSVQRVQPGQPLSIRLSYRSVFREHLRREFTSCTGSGHLPLLRVRGTL